MDEFLNELSNYELRYVLEQVRDSLPFYSLEEFI